MARFKAAIWPSLASLSVIFAALPVAAAPVTVIDATKSGILGDGTTLNTAAIQKTIDDCSSSGGGTIHFPPGRYLTGTIQLKSNVTLQLDDQATLLGSTNAADYRNVDPFIDGAGNPLGHALIVAVDADHVGIEGSGTVDGQGARLAASEKSYTMRPFLVRWVRCTNVSVKNVHLENPGAWTLNFFESKGVVIDGITIRSRDENLRNNDGINIDSSEAFQVHNCDVISGDDALVIKSTSDTRLCRDITASDCKLSTRTNAIKLGTESIGGFDDINVSNCQISNTAMAGIALYTVDGGNLSHVNIHDLTMDGVGVPISLRLGSRLKIFRQGEQPKTTPGQLTGITIQNVTAKNIGMVGMLINGVPHHPIAGVTLQNIQMELPGGAPAKAATVTLPEEESSYPEYDMFGPIIPAFGIYARHVSGIKLDNIKMTTLKPDARPATAFIDVQDVTPANFAANSSGAH
jgi:polygalacturonase